MKTPISSAAEFETIMGRFLNGAVVHYSGNPYYVIAVEAKLTHGQRHSAFAELEPANV